jgi:hypothetical protein
MAGRIFWAQVALFVCILAAVAVLVAILEA